MTDREKLELVLCRFIAECTCPTGTCKARKDIDYFLSEIYDANLVVMPQTATSAMRAVFIRFALDSGNVDPMWSARYWQEMVEIGKVK